MNFSHFGLPPNSFYMNVDYWEQVKALLDKHLPRQVSDVLGMKVYVDPYFPRSKIAFIDLKGHVMVIDVDMPVEEDES